MDDALLRRKETIKSMIAYSLSCVPSFNHLNKDNRGDKNYPDNYINSLLKQYRIDTELSREDWQDIFVQAEWINKPLRYQFNDKIDELIDTHLSDYLKQRCTELYKSGAVDINSFEDDYRLPKIILTAALKDAVFQFQPLTVEDKKAVKNLEKF